MKLLIFNNERHVQLPTCVRENYIYLIIANNYFFIRLDYGGILNLAWTKYETLSAQDVIQQEPGG